MKNVVVVIEKIIDLVNGKVLYLPNILSNNEQDENDNKIKNDKIIHLVKINLLQQSNNDIVEKCSQLSF
jgi:hypothetical protein